MCPKSRHQDLVSVLAVLCFSGFRAGSSSLPLHSQQASLAGSQLAKCHSLAVVTLVHDLLVLRYPLYCAHPRASNPIWMIDFSEASRSDRIASWKHHKRIHWQCWSVWKSELVPISSTPAVFRLGQGPWGPFLKNDSCRICISIESTEVRDWPPAKDRLQGSAERRMGCRSGVDTPISKGAEITNMMDAQFWVISAFLRAFIDFHWWLKKRISNQHKMLG